MKMGTRPKVFLAATASLTALAASPAFAHTGDAIIVTGSRIAKSEFTSPDPIPIIDPETANLPGPVQLADLLQSTPEAQGSIQINSPTSTHIVANSTEEHTPEPTSLM